MTRTEILWEKEAPELWWEEIAGPRMLVENVHTQLLSGNSVLLVTSSAFPWRWAFRGGLEMLMGNEGVSIELIDCADAYSGGDIGEFLVQQAAPGELSAYLRCVGDPMEWLRRADILSRRVIWFKGVSCDYSAKLLKFINHYRSTGLDEGCFVLELETPPENVSPAKHIALADYNETVTQTDLHLFCSLLADRYNIPAALREYVSALVTNLCVTDGEVAQALLQHMDFSTDDPITALENLRHEFPNNRGTEHTKDKFLHPFFLIRTENWIQLIRRVWRAQLQSAFPRIEMERLPLIERYESPVREALPLQYWDFQKEYARNVEQYGSTIQNPFEVEIGTLAFMLKAKRASDKKTPLLDISYEPDRRRIFFLRDMRNKLAHIYNYKNCTPAEMVRMLEGDESFFSHS